MTVPFDSYTLVNIFSWACNDKQHLLVLIRLRKLCPLPPEYCRHSYYCINNRRLFPLRTAAALCSQLYCLAWWKPKHTHSARGGFGAQGYMGSCPAALCPAEAQTLLHGLPGRLFWDVPMSSTLRQSRWAGHSLSSAAVTLLWNSWSTPQCLNSVHLGVQVYGLLENHALLMADPFGRGW